MPIYFIILGITVLGFGAVAFLLIKEKKSDNGDFTDTYENNDLSDNNDLQPIPDENELFNEDKKPSLLSKLTFWKKNTDESLEEIPVDFNSTEKKGSLVGKILGKLKFGKKSLDEDEDIPQATQFPNLKQSLDLDNSKTENLQDVSLNIAPKTTDTGTASLKINTEENPLDSASDNQEEPIAIVENSISQEEEKALDKEIDSSLELEDIKDEKQNLDKLMSEKNSALEKAEKSLEYEIKNRKEFNKVKNILEKELRDVKDNTKGVQKELTNANQEMEDYKKKVEQLEEKATNLEKELVEQEKPAPITKEPKEEVSLPDATTDSPEEKISLPEEPTTSLIIEESKEPKPTTPEESQNEKTPEEPKVVETPTKTASDIESLIEAPPEKKPEIYSVATKPEPEEIPPSSEYLEALKELNETPENTERAIPTNVEENPEEPQADTDEKSNDFVSLQPDVISAEDSDNQEKKTKEQLPNEEEKPQ